MEEGLLIIPKFSNSNFVNAIISPKQPHRSADCFELGDCIFGAVLTFQLSAKLIKSAQ
jgi:hypothetical protein